MLLNTVVDGHQNSRRDALIEEYRAYVNYVVGYLIDSMRLPAEHADEFVAAGYLGLVEAADRFDFQEGRNFKNFAFLRIRGAIIDSIRECSDLSGKAYQYAKALRAAHALRESLAEVTEAGSGTAGDPKDKAAKLEQIMDFAARGAMAFRVSILDLKDKLSTSGHYGDNPEVHYLAEENFKKIRDQLATLPEKERLVIEGYYFNDKSFVEIGKELGGLSKSWVSRLHSKALARLAEVLSQRDKRTT